LGIHDCNLNEIQAVFVYNARRQAIWQGFIQFYNLLQSVSEIDLIYVDGGFVTDNELPKDIDVVVEYPDMTTFLRLRVIHRFLEDRAYVKDTYKVDMLPCLTQLPAGANDLREYFQYVRPEDALKRGLPAGAKKGILRVSIR